jgi:four helix bundle protein
VYKKAIYLLCDDDQIGRDFGRRKPLEESASRPTAHIAEGFGSFNPPDFARFCVIARSSLMESQNHRRDFVDKKYITEERRLEVDQLAEVALEEVTGLMEYLQSPEALRNARRARERRTASRPERQTQNKEPRTANEEHRTELEAEDEPRSENSEG